MADNKEKHASYYYDSYTSDKTIKIPYGVEIIDENLFSSNNNIETVELPPTIKTIGYKAFENCNNLTEITNTDGIQNIDHAAFLNCKKLKGINLPDTLQTIGVSAFLNCSSIVRMIIPGSVKIIDDTSFAHCKSLKDVIIEEGVESIGYRAFKNCPNLKRVIIPSTISKIKSEAFEGCESLEEVITSIIPFINLKLYKDPLFKKNKVTIKILCNTLEEDSFYTDNRFTYRNIISRYIPPNLTIEMDNNQKIKKNRTIFDRNDLLSSAYETTYYKVPYGVEEISSNTFKDYYKLEEVTIPKTVKRIGAGAFEKCKKLKKVNFHEGLEEISNNAFEGCNSLEKIQMPNTLKFIDSLCFKDCSNLREVLLNEGLQYIKSDIFYGCENLKKITIPGSLKSVEGEWFLKVAPLEEVTLAEGIKTIEKNGFYSCRFLKKINFPNSLEVIEKEAFAGCEKLTCVVLPPNLKTIGAYAFLDCENISEISLPKSLLEIQDSAFRNTSIKELVLPINLQTMADNSLSDIYSLETVIVPYNNFQELYKFVQNNKEALYSFYKKRKIKITFKGPKISIREKIKLALQLNIDAYKFEECEAKQQNKKEEFIEEKPPITSYTGDEEIDIIINNIYNKIKYLPPDVKDKIRENVTKILNEYFLAKEELRPNLKDSINNTEVQFDRPMVKKVYIITELESINNSLKGVEQFNDTLKSINYYYYLLKDINPKTIENDSISKDILDILNILSKFPEPYQTTIKEKLETIIIKYKEIIEKEIYTLFDNNPLTNPSSEDYRTNLVNEIGKINTKVTSSLNILKQYLNLKRAFEEKMVEESEKEDILEQIILANNLINILPNGNFKNETINNFEELKRKCIDLIDQEIQTNDNYSLDKYNEITLIIRSRLFTIATEINEYNQQRKIERQKKLLNPTNTSKQEELQKLKNILKRCILLIQGKIDSSLMQNKKDFEGEIVKFYFSVINNKILTEEDKTTILSTLLLDLEKQVDKIEKGEYIPDNNNIKNEIFATIAMLKMNIFNYTSAKEEYDLAFNNGENNKK